MLFLALPSISVTAAAFIATAIAAFSVGVTVARKQRHNLPTYHDPDSAVRDLREKLNHPVRHALTNLFR